MALVWIVLAYLLGSVPFGLVFARTFCRVDPRTAGSGNVGATNVARLCGKGWGAATLLCDVLKGVLPLWLALAFTEPDALTLTLTALAAVFGHRYSCFLNFRGGKGVATSVGVFLALAFWQLFLSGALCLFLIWRSGFVSLGSLSLVTAMPLLLLVSARFDLIPLSIIIMLLVYSTHKDNIRRLARGEEKTWIRA